MRSYKSFERPSQILGIDINNLFVVMGFLIGSGVLVGLAGLVLPIHWGVYVFVLVVTLGLFFTFKYLAKHRPPGFALGFVSFHIRQPKRLSLGRLRQDHVRNKN